MPSEVALIPIYAALKSLLVGHAPLTSLLHPAPQGFGSGPGIYDEGNAPQLAPKDVMPYLTVGAGTQNPLHTMGPAAAAKWGWNCTIQIKATGQMLESAGLLILSRVAGLLYDGRELSVTGYATAQCADFTVQPTLHQTLAGVVTREFPAILRVYVHD